MRYLIITGLVFLVSSSVAQAETTNQDIIDVMNKQGINGCDSLIERRSPVEVLNNWYIDINKHAGGIDGPTQEVTIRRTFVGDNGKTMRIEDTYIQTPERCYITSVSQSVLKGGTCRQFLGSTDDWKLVSKMEGTSYSKYKSAGGADALAETIKGPGLNACVVEFVSRKSEPRQ